MGTELTAIAPARRAADVFTVPELRLTGLAAADTNAQFSTNAYRGGEIAGSATSVARK